MIINTHTTTEDYRREHRTDPGLNDLREKLGDADDWSDFVVSWADKLHGLDTDKPDDVALAKRYQTYWHGEPVVPALTAEELSRVRRTAP